MVRFFTPLKSRFDGACRNPERSPGLTRSLSRRAQAQVRTLLALDEVQKVVIDLIGMGCTHPVR